MGKCQIWQKLAKNGQKTPKITWACGKVKLGTPVSVKKALPGGSELSEMLLKLQQFAYELVGFVGVFGGFSESILKAFWRFETYIYMCKIEFLFEKICV